MTQAALNSNQALQSHPTRPDRRCGCAPRLGVRSTVMSGAHRRVPQCGQRYATPSTGVVSTVMVTNAVSAPRPTAWLRNWMSIFGVPPWTLIFPTGVQADTSRGFIVTCTLSEPGTGPVVLRQASSISTSARARLTEKRRVEVSRLGLHVGIAWLPPYPTVKLRGRMLTPQRRHWCVRRFSVRRTVRSGAQAPAVHGPLRRLLDARKKRQNRTKQHMPAPSQIVTVTQKRSGSSLRAKICHLPSALPVNRPARPRPMNKSARTRAEAALEFTN